MLQTIDIQQSPNNIERIDHTILSKMYDAYLAVMQNRNGSGSTLRGQLSVDRAYQYWVTNLTRKWSGLRINVDNGGIYYPWEDEEFTKCIAQVWGDGYGIIESQFTGQNRSTRKSKSTYSPFYNNKKIKVIDLRPFNNLLIEGTYDENMFYVVPRDRTTSDYQLEEIYVSNVKQGTDPNINAFIGGTNTRYTLQKFWWECPDRTDDTQRKILPGSSGESNLPAILIEHYYFFNHSTGYGQNYKHTVDIDGDTIEYLDYSAGWQCRGMGANNVIIDSPIPIQIGGYGFNGYPWSKTAIWVPNNQLALYQKLYSQSSWQQPKQIKAIDDYNTAFPSLKNWWIYPGKNQQCIASF